MKNTLYKNSPLSLVGDKYSKILKGSSVVILAAAFIVSGFFIANNALAAATVNPASGGTNISIDTTSHSDCTGAACGTFKTLIGPSFGTESGDIAIGTHTINLPAGWEFDTGSTITIISANDIIFANTSVTPTANSFSFEITKKSTVAGSIIFSGLKVRPTGITPSNGNNMTYSGSGAGIVGVDGNINFGTLSTVPGAVDELFFEVQPGGAEYGSLLNPQPVVVTRDQFGNNSTNELAETEIVTMTLSGGTGALIGDATLDIGTNAGNGTVTFTNLTVDEFGTDKQLTASATGLTSAISGNFEITKKPLTATITVADKVYDGNTSATINTITLNGVETGDTVTADITTTPAGATFAIANAGTHAISVTGVILAGADKDNYTLANADITGTGTINPLEITITPTTGQTKIYGEADPTFAYTPSPALISPDIFSGALSRVAGEDVNTYAYILGDLSAGSNYALSLGGLETFAITQRTLNVTAVGINKVYDGNTTATVTLSDDRVLGDNLTLGYTAVFTDSKDVGVGKPVSVTGIAITGGDDAGNYILGNTTTATTADITPAQLTVSFTTDADKTYDGDNSADITGRSINDGVIDTEDVDVTGGSATFANKHVGTGLTVTATGFTLTGADSGNYEIGTINTTTGNVNPRSITVTAVADGKTYDGTTDSNETPEITSSFSPPVALVDTANFIQTFDTKHFGTEKVLTPSGVVIDGNPIEGSNYTVTIVTVSTGEIIKKSINVTAQPNTKTYDGNIGSIVVPIVDPLEASDTVGTAPIQSYDTAGVGTGKTLTPSGLVINDGNGGANYTIVPVTNTVGVINKKGLTVTGATTNSKIYDGGVTATVNFTSATLDGVVPGEGALVSLNSTGYSATYDNKNVATGKTVTVSGLALSGTGVSNYSLTQPVLNDGVITVRTLVVTAIGTTKVYDSTLDATDIVTLSDDRVDGDVLTLTHTATFLTKDVANGKDVNVTGIAITGGTDAGNYTLNGVTTAPTTADITPATLTATITASDKVYDGNNSATITGYTPVDVLGSDVVVLSGGEATFDNFNVIDENNAVSATGINITGADAGNYTYDGAATGEANITPLEISGSFTADNKTYDGTAVASILTRNLTGVLPQDVGNVSLTGGTAAFADANVGDDIVVTEIVAMTLTGSAAGNYELTGVDTTTANITKASLTITADDKSKVYGDANPELTATYSGFVNDETATILDTQVTLSTIAVAGSSVGNYAITASGAADNNYEITHANGTLTVTPATLTVTADAQNKTYGDSDPTLFTYTATGYKNSDSASVFSGVLSRVANENVGNYVISIGSLSAGNNYTISFTGANLTINKRALTISAVTDTKPYDGGITSDETPTITDGELQFGQSSAFTQSFNSPDAGNDKVLTAAGIVNDGNGGANYSYNFSNTAVGVISPLGITVSPTAGQTKVYGQLDPTFAYTNNPALLGGNQFTGALSRIAGDDVNTYAYTLGTLSAGSNYALTVAPGTFAITKATPVITWANPAGIVYGTALSGTQLNATADVGGTFVYTPAAGTVLNVGNAQELSVTFTPTDALNYGNKTAEVLINVTKASLTVTAENKLKEYLANDPALTYTHSELVNGDTDAVFTGALVRDEGELADTYSILQDTLSAGDNYTITFTPGTFTITDTVNPSVISPHTTPSLNAVNISPSTAIVVTFSEAVVVETVDVSFNPAIFGGFTITNSGTSIVTITPNNPLADNTTYTITLNGVADLNGNLLPTYSNIKFTTATNYSINLNANGSGWNLISLPVVPSNTAIATVLGDAADDIHAVWTYDPTNINANAINGGWFVYNPDASLSSLSTMTAGHGYWISVISDTVINGSGSLLIAGPTTPPSVSLATGWNLVGYYQIPGESSSNMTNAFKSIGTAGTGYTSLFGFNNATGASTNVGTILPGDAFWISVSPNGGKDYTPSNL